MRLGSALLVCAVGIAVRIGGAGPCHVAGGAAAALVLGAATVVTPSGCETETV